MDVSAGNQADSEKASVLDMAKWQSIIAEWEASKESQKRYCTRLGINLNTFTYVRSKLGLVSKPKFIPVTVNPSANKGSESIDRLVIETPQGFKLHISSSLSVERLAKIFRLCGLQDA